MRQFIYADCRSWLRAREDNSVHAVVTDPPFGVKEYTPEEVEKLRSGKGGTWRQPTKIGGCVRRPVPRFTTLTPEELAAARQLFFDVAEQLARVLVPGAHVFIASNPLLSHLCFGPMMEAGLEKRGEVIRLVQTRRGGDRPKNADKEFSDATVMPRSCYEPWGLFRKPIEGRVQDNLRRWGTGALRRESAARPFCDVIPSGRTPARELEVSPHPSLKPQDFMRRLVRAALPFGRGVLLDPFMGGASTIGAAMALGYEDVIGIEMDLGYYEASEGAARGLAEILVGPAAPITSARRPAAARRGPTSPSPSRTVPRP